MIVNTAIATLFKAAPSVPPDFRESLIRWLKLIDGEEFHPVFQMQLEMVDQLLDFERRIRECDEVRKGLKSEIPSLKASANLGQIRSHQAQISALEDETATLRYLRDCILFVGDTIAVHFLEPDAIKHFALYPPSGFMSGKDGLRAEIDAMHHFYFKEGYFVLLNDLTHSVRVGDLTLKKGEEVRTFEVKSTAEAYKERETIRQIVTPIMIHDYIKRDVIKRPLVLGDGRVGAGATRIGSGIEEDWHIKVAGRLYDAMRRSGVGHIELGKKHYLAARARYESDLRQRIVKLTEPDDWVVANIRRRVTHYADIPPFSKWFKPETCVEILAGDLILLSAISMSDLRQLLADQGVDLTWTRKYDDLFPRSFRSEQPADLEVQFAGDWQWLRMLYSFLSIETFVHICSFMLSPEAIKRFKQAMDDGPAAIKPVAREGGEAQLDAPKLNPSEEARNPKT